MHGNIWEWYQDWYGPYGKLDEAAEWTDPQGPDSGSERVFRGGNLYSDAFSPQSARRRSFPPGTRHPGLGARLLRTR